MDILFLSTDVTICNSLFRPESYLHTRYDTKNKERLLPKRQELAGLLKVLEPYVSVA